MEAINDGFFPSIMDYPNEEMTEDLLVRIR